MITYAQVVVQNGSSMIAESGEYRERIIYNNHMYILNYSQMQVKGTYWMTDTKWAKNKW